MGDTAAFYQTFFQYDTLFKVYEEDMVEKNVIQKPAKEPVAVIIEPEPVPSETPLPVTAPPIVASVNRETVPFPALRHRILVLVDEPRHPELPPSQALLLENILKATGNASSEIDLLNFSYIPQADARTVLAQKSTNYFISFGVPMIRLQLDLLLPPYTPQKIEGIWFLLTDSLDQIEADKSLKKRLWLALQQMFGIA
jgi:hypothetical protein